MFITGRVTVMVTIAISSRLQPLVVEATPVNEHIMALRLKLAFGFMSVIAPTEVCKLDMKEKFYRQLSSSEILIIRGDFNAVFGCDQAGYEMSVSSHGTGDNANSENNFYQD